MSDNEAATTPDDERRQMALAARRFFLEDRSKIEIAAELGVSRFKVARLLEQARETGVVTITVHDSGVMAPALAARVAEHLGLSRVVVVESGPAPEEVRRVVGEAAAHLLGRTLHDGEVLGMAWGRTLAAMSAALPALPRTTVVQLTGVTGHNIADSPVEILRQVALRSGGAAYPIFAPLVVGDPRTAEALRAEPGVARAFELYDRLTTAVVSVGSWDPPNSQLYASLDPAERDRLRDEGVRAEVTAALLAADGTQLAPDVVARSITIPAELLRRTPRIVAAAGGADKAHAVLAAVRAGLTTELVTDRSLAEELLRLPAVVPTGDPGSP
ncbi:sugar-binding transcriptional regulator [Cellulomonas endophytica]|uniref:sugar-binding transcriptional regulator n=1 Tax=Cellulomonas endophytica TaxID=2494735 RepID=UPI001012586D|nr:sugar-binding domain-containing protein [Cellulomonas endophytica]